MQAHRVQQGQQALESSGLMAMLNGAKEPNFW